MRDALALHEFDAVLLTLSACPPPLATTRLRYHALGAMLELRYRGTELLAR